MPHGSCFIRYIKLGFLWPLAVQSGYQEHKDKTDYSDQGLAPVDPLSYSFQKPRLTRSTYLHGTVVRINYKCMCSAHSKCSSNSITQVSFLPSSIISWSITHMAPPLHHQSYCQMQGGYIQLSVSSCVFTPDNSLIYRGKMEVWGKSHS